ncbi:MULTISPECIES: SCO family protein [Methylocystis]|uniref:SCO family protein n=1 Tax=Methylocystis TaxID=133 RepID=UPI0019212E64|nr:MULTISPECIES: SCO family protein [Methylocystis]MBL1257398.1 SCO family protein [Methylocystis sp. Sn-Cys]MDJ0448979.1 SCO family protein [Methylocystis sp. JR02]
MSRGSVKGNGRNKRGDKKAANGPAISKGLLIGAGAVFALIFGVFVAVTSNTPPAPPASAIGGPFQLTSQTGAQVNEKELLGKPYLIFFGYTHCPDVCHTTLFEMSEILRALGPDAKVGGLFVTVDPERDTPEVLKDYLANFDPRITGLTGPRAQLEPMLRSYRIYAKRAPGKDEDYAVDHTTVVYLMDKNGRFVTSFNVNRKPEEAAKDLARYL